MTWARRRLICALAAATTSALAGCGPGSPAVAPAPAAARPLAEDPGGLPTHLPSTAPTSAGRPAVAPGPAFSSSVSAITPAVRARMYSSWRPGCPVPLADLRYVQVSYWGFDGAVHRGELVVHARAVGAVVPALRSVFAAHFPLAAMRLVDAHGGPASAAIAEKDTAAFNCRSATGRPGVWSQHSYGLAIDINPVQNPYVGAGGFVAPPGSRPYADRSRQAAGMIKRGDVVVRAFAAVGWSWGGDWVDVKDYQHFSSTGR